MAAGDVHATFSIKIDPAALTIYPDASIVGVLEDGALFGELGVDEFVGVLEDDVIVGELGVDEIVGVLEDDLIQGDLP